MPPHHTDSIIFGTAISVMLVWLVHAVPWLQGLASVAAIVASGVAIYYKIKNKGR